MDKQTNLVADQASNEKLLTAQAVADLASVHPKTALNWARRGLIPVVRINRRVIRFKFSDVASFLHIGSSPASN